LTAVVSTQLLGIKRYHRVMCGVML